MKGTAKPADKRKVNRRGIAIEEAYQKIKKMIYLNQLAPGQKIIYNDLGKRLNISVTPVIQALNRLEASGFVTYTPNKGYFVGEITVQEAMQLYEAREALEIYIVPKVIENLNPKNLQEIKEAFGRHRTEQNNILGRRLILLDAQFHLKIVGFSGNEVICKMLQEIFEKLYLKYRPEYLHQDRVKEIAQEHRMVLEALQRRDVEGAVATIRSHIISGRARVIDSLISQQESAFPLSESA
ncbi:MAG: GntR family transcriptional regulator [Desulfarculus sp.]|jgi:DNA-binding GntR family transcriptional regulator|nr:MAG: GntR family transcriptional regulator [Desulfarculus sp.]